MGRVQAELIKYIRKGIEYLVKAALGLNVPEEAAQKVPVDPKTNGPGGFSKQKPKGTLLKRVKKILDMVLQALGCAIEDLIEKLVNWLVDLLFNFIMDVFSPAACAVINLVDGILNQILSLIDSLIASVMGPLQSILSILGGGLNIVGSAIAKVMSFLGITCSGPSGKCGEDTVKCNDCGTDEDDEDFLDNLLKDLEEGDTGERFTCEESQDYSEEPPTKVIFVGGVPTWEPPLPEDGTISTPPGSEVGDPTPDSFFPSEADDPAFDPNIVPDFTNTETFENTDLGGEEIIDTVDDPFEDPDDDIANIPLPRFTDGTPTYLVTASPVLVTEGDTITYTIRTTNVPAGTILDYTLSGTTIVPEYIVGGSLTGSFTILDNGSETLESINEDDELVDVVIPFGIATVQIQLADAGVVKNFLQVMRFTVDDTDAFADVTITYDVYDELRPNYDPGFTPFEIVNVVSDKELYYEGEDITYTITSENIPDGTRLNYIIYGDIVPDDLIGGNLEGSFVIRNNASKVVVSIVEDLEIETDETVHFKILNYDATATVTIVGDAEATVTTEEIRPQLDRPTAGSPITDDRGAIIDIPVQDTGSPYQTPPYVIITGAGFGATGIALLDDQGYVSEIRVTRGGLGYKKNTAKDNNLRCIIDSFTLISPGVKYTSAPEVYIDGEKGFAEAIIDSRGYVTSVRIKDRTKTFQSSPKVKLVGGGGAGAIVLPNLVCLDPDDLASRGSVKIGTGKYIDCP